MTIFNYHDSNDEGSNEFPLEPCVYYWSSRYQTLEETSERVCYQVNSNPEVCIEGDSYEITSDYDFDNSITYAWYVTWEVKYTNINGHDWTSPIQTFAFNTGGNVTNYYCIQGNGSLLLYVFSPNQNIAFIRSVPNSWGAIYRYSIQAIRTDTGQEENKVNKIEIYKEGQKVHEFTSSQEISAYIEPPQSECKWSDWSDWNEYSNNDPNAKLFTSGLGVESGCLYLVAERSIFTGKKTKHSPNLPVAYACSDEGCELPQFRIRKDQSCLDDPPPPPECNKLECPEGYYFDFDRCLCLPNPCPEGYYRNDEGDCVIDESNKPPPECSPKECPDGYYWEELVCDCVKIPKKLEPKCNDPKALNFGGTLPCIYPEEKKCKDPKALNYGQIEECEYKKGCTKEWADNYDSEAIIDDGSCYRYGCTDPTAKNYDPLATINDDSCEYPTKGCKDPRAFNFDPSTDIHEQSLCIYFDDDNIFPPVIITPPSFDDNDPPPPSKKPPKGKSPEPNPSECKECPPQTAFSLECSGYVCCYDGNCCLISYFPISEKC